VSTPQPRTLNSWHLASCSDSSKTTLSHLSGPDLRKIYSSFSKRLGIRANLQLQRIYTSKTYKRLFKGTQIGKFGVLTEGLERNRECVQYKGEAGYFRNTTVGGSVTGESLDIGVMDDPIKGREEANSTTKRQKVWDWFTDDLLTRFSDCGALLGIMTRWHVDDPFGRLEKLFEDSDDLAQFGKITVYSRPAIATETEEHRDIGEPLFPALKSLRFLLSRKALLTQLSWESLYQQRPFIKGGGMFAIEHFKIVERVPELKGRPVRSWDKAATEDGGAYTAGVKMAETKDGQFIILDVVRKQLSPLRREKVMRLTAELDTKRTSIIIEKEGGSGGKESADNSIRNLAGFVVEAKTATGSKEDRAEPYAAQVEGGNVLVLEGDWNKDFIDEHELFPNSKYKDQVDAAAGAFNKITSSPVLGFTERQKKDIKSKSQKKRQELRW